MTKTLCGVLGAMLLIPSAPAQAQECLGLPSLATHPTNLLLDADFTKGAKGFGARFGFGSSIAFGGVAAQLQKYDNVSGTGKAIAIDGGLSVLVGEKKTVTFCPIASLGYTMLPDLELLGVTAKSNDTEGTAGVALGGNVAAGTGLSLIPFASISAAYSRTSVKVESESSSSSDTYGVLAGGLGFLFNRSVVIRPTVTIPLGLSGSDPTYGIGVAFGFGKR